MVPRPVRRRAGARVAGSAGWPSDHTRTSRPPYARTRGPACRVHARDAAASRPPHAAAARPARQRGARRRGAAAVRRRPRRGEARDRRPVQRVDCSVRGGAARATSTRSCAGPTPAPSNDWPSRPVVRRRASRSSPSTSTRRPQAGLRLHPNRSEDDDRRRLPRQPAGGGRADLRDPRHARADRLDPAATARPPGVAAARRDARDLLRLRRVRLRDHRRRRPARGGRAARPLADRRSGPSWWSPWEVPCTPGCAPSRTGTSSVGAGEPRHAPTRARRPRGRGTWSTSRAVAAPAPSGSADRARPGGPCRRVAAPARRTPLPSRGRGRAPRA